MRFAFTTLTMGLFVSLISGPAALSIGHAQAAKLKNKIRIDGSSTVFPITEAIAEKFREIGPRIKVNIGVSGTGGGFKKFTAGEIDINDASRKIKDGEAKLALKNGVKYMEIPVAYDGLTVVVNPKNTWATDMTVAELKKIWDKGSTVKNWKDVRPNWPDRPIKLYGPGTDSGTFDYFTKVINGESGRNRSSTNYVMSEDDNILVTGVSKNLDSLGYFGFAYYHEHRAKLKAVKIEGVAPTVETINNGTYKPLSRPVFIYVSDTAYKRPAVSKFVDFYLKEAPEIVSDVGYVSLPLKKYQDSLKDLKAMVK